MANPQYVSQTATVVGLQDILKGLKILSFQKWTDTLLIEKTNGLAFGRDGNLYRL